MQWPAEACFGRLNATPGQSTEDISTLVETAFGLVACTDLWWSADGSYIDPLAADRDLLKESRAKLPCMEPGHWSLFTRA